VGKLQFKSRIKYISPDGTPGGVVVTIYWQMTSRRSYLSLCSWILLARIIGSSLVKTHALVCSQSAATLITIQLAPSKCAKWCNNNTQLLPISISNKSQKYPICNTSYHMCNLFGVKMNEMYKAYIVFSQLSHQSLYIMLSMCASIFVGSVWWIICLLKHSKLWVKS
jgi:hypothetical protein